MKYKEGGVQGRERSSLPALKWEGRLKFVREARSPAMLFIWGSGEGPDDTLTAVRPGGRRTGAEVNLETVILKKVTNDWWLSVRRYPENLSLGGK
jgi:hypothetical protein